MDTTHLDIIAIAVMLAVTAFACVWDMKTRKLPNWFTVPVFASGVLYHTVNGYIQPELTIWSGLGFSLCGFAVGFGILFVLMLIGGGGGGDVKFMAALGSWIGVWFVMFVFIGSGVVALIGMIGVMMWKMMTRVTEPMPAVGGSGGETVESPGDQAKAARETIPYAVTICISAWIVLALKLVVIINP
ncbi:MAG: hypothetical protein COA78_08010 [Blastopirellula sp.]|nr:MAG: hypothetical protein COA78_08010 [Blastopirellula sp.]